MVVTLVVLSFVVLVALDHFVISRRKAPATAPAPVVGPPASLASAAGPPPSGTWLQPTGTWSRLADGGEVLLGVHPLLLDLVGWPRQLELLEPGAHVARGEPLARIGREGRQLAVPSPVTGRIEAVFREPADQFGWRHATERDGEWLYRVLPERLDEESASWLSGEAAGAWVRRRYEEVREFLLGAFADRHLGPTLADGGDLPVGVLGGLDQGVWSGLEGRFLVPGGPEVRP